MQALSADQLVGQILGNYRIERFLGKGRLNAVYLARHLASQRLDALTMYLVPSHFSVEGHRRFLTRFRKESAAIIKLDHQYILPIYENGEYAGTPYLITPYVNQGSLADMLKRHGRYDHKEVVPILEQIASGVAYAHNRGCIHGTLRPSNVVVRDQDTLQVAGFGLMHMLQLSGIEQSEQPYAHLLTVAQTFLASPEYIAPEVVQGQVIDVRSDIYALGCIIFELLSGRPPFSGSDPLETARLHVTESIPSLHTLYPEVPIALASVVNQALERDPARRFQHVEELKEAFIQGSRGASSTSSQGRRYVEEESDWAETVQMAERLQDTPANGYKLGNTNKWQLLPPIVTGKLSAVQLPPTQGLFSASSKLGEQDVHTSPGGRRENRGASRPERHTGQETLPPIAPVSAQETHQRYQSKPATPTLLPIVPDMPTASAGTASPTLVPERNSRPPAYQREMFTEPARTAPNLPPSRPQSEDMIVRDATAWSENRQAAPASSNLAMNSMPGAQEDTNRLVQSYSWWSQPGAQNAEVREERVKNARAQTMPQSPMQLQAQPAQPPPSSREPLFLRNSDTVSWMSEPVVPDNVRRTFGAAAPKKNKMSRRSAIAFLATGGVVAAGTVGVLNLKHLLPSSQTPTAHTQTNNAANVAHTNTQQTQQKAQTKPTTAPQKTGTQNTGTTQNTAPQGHVIGSTKQATNTAATFANPANDTPALLVRLASGTFVAYEQACTHQGVLVNYDPATKLLKCPAHGAIFDPANGGAVVQGPAQQPIPKVNVQVQANGTITTL